MKEFVFIGLPLKTWGVVGAAFLISSLLPFVVAFILRRKKVLKEDE